MTTSNQIEEKGEHVQMKIKIFIGLKKKPCRHHKN